MKAIIITKYGGPEVLKSQESPTPEITGDEILIELKAAGLNHADIFQREGNYPAPKGTSAEIPALEVVGIVIKRGTDVIDFNVGDNVCALLSGGGYTEYVSVREGQCLPIPANLSFAEAASLLETVFTVWSNVFQRARVQTRRNAFDPRWKQWYRNYRHSNCSHIGFQSDCHSRI